MTNLKLVVEDKGNNSRIEILFRGKLVLHNSGSGAAAGGTVSLPDKKHLNEYLTAKVGWLMTVAALFVQMAFQAALQPPTWMPTNWIDQGFRQLRHRKPGGDVAPSPATTSAPSNHDSETMISVTMGYVALNTQLHLHVCKLI
ncbi:hypothetical protein ABZP36_014453 [Zizania latifolia]